IINKTIIDFNECKNTRNITFFKDWCGLTLNHEVKGVDFTNKALIAGPFTMLESINCKITIMKIFF
ncbi:hypothetical protein EA161_17115, partial [Klebsiella pneumoniae]